MKKADKGNFILAFLLNLALNFEWAIPAVVLLILHFAVKLSIFWFWLALGLWLGGILAVSLVFSLANRYSDIDRPRENKNPYSATNASVFGQKKKD